MARQIVSRLFGTLPDALLHGGLIVAAITFVLALPFFTRNGTADFTADVLQHAYVLIWMMALTALGRTLPLRTLAAFFFVGLFLNVLLLQWLGAALARVVGTGRVFDSLLVPVLEEGIKVVPIILLFWLMSRRGWQPSMTDGLMLGFVIGAGIRSRRLTTPMSWTTSAWPQGASSRRGP